MGAFDFLYNSTEKEVTCGETLDKQPLFNLSDKESKYLNLSRFIVLCSHGKKEKETYKNVKQGLWEMGFSEDVLLIKDNCEIVKFGVVNTPALVVDGKVVTYGRYLTVEDVKEIFQKFRLD